MPDIPVHVSVWSVWLATVLWTLISSLAFLDAAREHLDSLKERRLSKPLGNGRYVVARARVWASRGYSAGFGASALIGALSCVLLVYSPPPPDTSYLNASVRALFMLMIGGFWIPLRVQRGVRSRLKRMANSHDAARQRKE